MSRGGGETSCLKGWWGSEEREMTVNRTLVRDGRSGIIMVHDAAILRNHSTIYKQATL